MTWAQRLKRVRHRHRVLPSLHSFTAPLCAAIRLDKQLRDGPGGQTASLKTLSAPSTGFPFKPSRQDTLSSGEADVSRKETSRKGGVQRGLIISGDGGLLDLARAVTGGRVAWISLGMLSLLRASPQRGVVGSDLIQKCLYRQF